jgi:hypothetical protein
MLGSLKSAQLAQNLLNSLKIGSASSKSAQLLKYKVLFKISLRSAILVVINPLGVMVPILAV